MFSSQLAFPCCCFEVALCEAGVTFPVAVIRAVMLYFPRREKWLVPRNPRWQTGLAPRTDSMAPQRQSRSRGAKPQAGATSAALECTTLKARPPQPHRAEALPRAQVGGRGTSRIFSRPEAAWEPWPTSPRKLRSAKEQHLLVNMPSL